MAQTSHDRGAGLRRPGRRCWMLLPLVLLGTTGCMSYNWRGTTLMDLQAAEKQAREQNKYLFIFYKYWLDSNSTRMIDMLSDPEVHRHFQGTINLLVDRQSPEKLVEFVGRFGATSPPTAVIVAPDGTYQAVQGYVPKDRFLEFVKRAKGEGNRPGSAGKASGPSS